MSEQRKAAIPDVFFITSTSEKSIFVSPFAVCSEEDKREIHIENIHNETGSELEIGDKVLATLDVANGSSRIAVIRTIAKRQPIAASDSEYLRSLRIYINDEKQRLNLEEINVILETIIGIDVHRVDQDTFGNYHLVIDIDNEDPGTEPPCPFLWPAPSMSYPCRIPFPRVSNETKRFLKMIYPDGEATETRIFAFRLIHFLLHRLGYHVHINPQSSAEYGKLQNAIREGDPSQVSIPDVTKACLCDWHLIHFVAVQSHSLWRSFDNMMCDGCKKTRIPIGVGLEDFHARLDSFLDSSKPRYHSQNEKRIFYVVQSRKDGLILNESPYLSKKTINVTERDWITAVFDSYEKLDNIFVPNDLLHTPLELRRGDKILLDIRTESVLKKGEPRVSQKATSFNVDRLIKRQARIINPSNFFSRFRPFHLGVTLKIGPDVNLNFVEDVAHIVSRLTNWHIKIDRSSYQELGDSFSRLNSVYEEWKSSSSADRSRLVAKAKTIVDNLPARRHEIEDSFNVLVYVFPEESTFIEDVFGTTAFGKALHRVFAVVRLYPSAPPGYEKEEPCKSCTTKPLMPIRKEITALFIIHEVLHITSGLDDHRGCSSCLYGREEMKPLRVFCCEECIREGNDSTQANCLMSYECLLCASSRIPRTTTISQLLCEKCRKKLLPAEQFVSKQAARLNSIIYRGLLEGQH